MTIRVAQQSSKERISDPRVCISWQRDECHKPGEDPNIGYTADDGALLEPLREPSDDQKVHREQELGRDSQQVGLEDREAESTQDEG